MDKNYIELSQNCGTLQSDKDLVISSLGRLLHFYSMSSPSEWTLAQVNRSRLALCSGSTQTLGTGWSDRLMHTLFILQSDLVALCVCVCASELQSFTPRVCDSIQGDWSCQSRFATETRWKRHTFTHQLKGQFMVCERTALQPFCPAVSLPPLSSFVIHTSTHTQHNTHNLSPFNTFLQFLYSFCLCLFTGPAASADV